MTSHLPDKFKDFPSRKSTMPGQNGEIKIEMASDKKSKTYIKSLMSRAPFLVQKAIYPDPSCPHFAHVYMMSSSGGILQGDEQRVDITMGENTTARITNQSATKIYRMDEGYASQYIGIHCKRGSYLEFIPHQIIPFKGSRFYQEVNMEVDEGAVLIYSEIISAGRLASGEKFDFDLCFFRMSAHREGKLLFSDAMNLDRRGNPDLESVFGGRKVLSTAYIVGNSIPSDRIAEEIGYAIKNSALLASCSSLPHNCGLIVRMLSNSVSDIIALTEMIAAVQGRQVTTKSAIQKNLQT